MSTLAVICKEPVPGRVKTRLCPPCTLEDAARLAEAALRDTFAAVLATRCERRVAVLDGSAGPWLPAGIEVVRQRGDGLDTRLAHAFADVGGPIFLIGMDTPQVTPGLLAAGLRAVGRRGAALGMATDGGYWGIGLAEPDPEVFLGVPMSTAVTGEEQLRRLIERGRRPAMLPALADVDDIDTARRVAAAAPHGRFARALAGVEAGVAA